MAVNIIDRADDLVAIESALISVSDKTMLEGFVKGLVEMNPRITILSTGGTHKAIAEVLGAAAGNNLRSVSDYTGQPEMQGGLVKTLDFKIYMGLLSETYNDAHRMDMERTGAQAIDMVVANLYPFKATVARAGATPEEARANIDIGGPCMVRAAAKNFVRVASVVNPSDYGMILEEMKSTGGSLCLETRFKLACKAFAHTAEYDSAIAGYLSGARYEEVKGCYLL